MCVCLGIEHQLVLGTWVSFAYIYNGPTRTLTGAVGLESDILHLHFSSRFSESPRLLVAGCVVLKKTSFLHFRLQSISATFCCFQNFDGNNKNKFK